MSGGSEASGGAINEAVVKLEAPETGVKVVSAWERGYEDWESDHPDGAMIGAKA